MEVLHGGVGGAEVDEAVPNRPVSVSSLRVPYCLSFRVRCNEHRRPAKSNSLLKIICQEKKSQSKLPIPKVLNIFGIMK